MNTPLASARRVLTGLGLAAVLVVGTPVPASATTARLPVAAQAQAAAASARPATATVHTATVQTAEPRAAAAALPAGFVRHTSRFWTWFGPRDWIASYSIYGLTVSAPRGIATWDYGGSSTYCYAAATWPASAARFFAARRLGIQRGSGASAFTWTAVSAIATIATRSYRQVAYFIATVRGVPISAQIVLIYSDNGGGYCYQSADARVAVRAQFATLLKTMSAIAANTTYLSPGVCNPTLFDPRRC